MLNERKLTKSELAKREDIIMKMKKNKRSLVQKYGKDAEAVMYGRATNLAKKQAESMDQDKIKELVKDALQNPKKADLNKDGKLSDYEKKRGAAIEKAMANEMDINDPVAMRLRADKMKAANAGDDGNDKFFRKNAIRLKKLKALKDKRAQIMRDMEQEAEMEGGPIADRYGDLLNKIDAAISKLSDQGKGDEYMSKDEIERRAAMIGLEEGFYGPSQLDKIIGNIGYDDLDHFFEDNPGAISAILDFIDQHFPDAMDGELSSVYENLSEGASTEEKRIAMRAIRSIAKYRGVSVDIARDDLIRAANEIGDLKEDLDLGHQDDEPHMLKADLYRIGKYAMELYQMVDKFEEGSEEVDFPHWWQSKVIKAKDMLVGAKHYLDFEIKEPQIDAMVDVAQDVEAIDEAVGKFVVRPCSNPGTPFAVWQTSKDGENDKRIKGFKTKEDAKKFADEKNSVKENTLKEGTWAVGSSKDIKSVMDALDQMMDLKNPKDIVRYLSKLDKFLYNTVGDDVFHDDIDGAKREASEGNMDRAMNRLADAYSRAEYFLERQMDREGLKEEEAGEADMVASDIQKAMNKHKKDDAKIYQLQQARKAMNKGDLDKAKKIAARLAEKLKSE